jgi:type IV pilus assembly protein PilA
MMRSASEGFTIIELMIGLAIVGVLASLAIANYQDYTARGQVTEAMELMSGGKNPLSEYYAQYGFWPSNATAVMGTVSGKYTANVQITTGNGGTGALELTATMKNTGVFSSIQGRTLSLSTSFPGGNWTCASTGAGAIEPRYLPPICR